MLSKCTVTGPFNRPDGKPFANARLTFKLSGRDREDDTIVMPSPVSVMTDAGGDFSVELWPNSEGYAGTSYTASVVGYPPFRVVVPDVPTAKLALIMDLVPDPAVSDWQPILDEMRQIGAEVGELRVPITALYDDLDKLNALYGIRTEIAGVYDIRVALLGVHGLSTEIQAVYAYRVAIVSVSDNMAAILSAQGYAQTATDKAAEAVAARNTAVATTQVRFDTFGPIENDTGIGLGGYVCERRVFRASSQQRLYAEIIASGGAGSVTFYVDRNGAMISGPHTVNAGAALDIAAAFSTAVGDKISIFVTAMSGNVTKFYAASYGVVA